MKIKSISGNTPHPDYGSWENFLKTCCHVISQCNGVVHYSSSNCNYIVFPDGTLVENFGFNGQALMNHIRDEGVETVLSRIRQTIAQLRQVLA